MKFTQENIIAALKKVDRLEKRIAKLELEVANTIDDLRKHERLVEGAHTPWLKEE